MKKTMSRTLILRALRTEPHLTKGTWARWLDGDKKTCEVCAVGAVLRRAFRTNNADRIGRLGVAATDNGSAVFSSQFIKSNLERGHYLNALSCVYESAHPNWARRKAIAFVKEYFPKQITIEV